MDLSLVQTLVTLVVALAGIAGTAWGARLQNKGERDLQRLEQIRAVSARVLSSAHETQTALAAMNFTMVHYKWGERNAGRTQEEWLAAYDEANRKLRIAADELLLLEASVERCVNELLDGLSLGSAPDKILAASRPGGQFDVERNALRNQLRHVLKG